MSFRRALSVVAVLLAGVLTVRAQTLPSGLTQSGSVVMMQPIPDYDSNPAETGPSISHEQRPGQIHYLSAADHDLFTRAFDAADRGDWLTRTVAGGSGSRSGRPPPDRLALSARQEQRREFRRDRCVPEGQPRLARARHALCPRRSRARPQHDAGAGHRLVRQPRAGERHRQDPSRRSFRRHRQDGAGQRSHSRRMGRTAASSRRRNSSSSSTTAAS